MMLPSFNWRATTLVALLLQATLVASVPWLSGVTWYPKASLSAFSTRRVVTISTTSGITPTMIVPVTTITASSPASPSTSVTSNAAVPSVASSDVAFVETAIVTDVVIIDPVAGSTSTTELPAIVDSSSSLALVARSSSSSSTTPTTTTRTRKLLQTTVTSRPVVTEIVTLPTIVETFTSTALEVHWSIVPPPSDTRGPVITTLMCEGHPHRVHSFHNPFSKPFGCPKPKPKCPPDFKHGCHTPKTPTVDPDDVWRKRRRTVHVGDVKPGPMVVTADAVAGVSTSTSTLTSVALVTMTLSDSPSAETTTSTTTSSTSTPTRKIITLTTRPSTPTHTPTRKIFTLTSTSTRSHTPPPPVMVTKTKTLMSLPVVTVTKTAPAVVLPAPLIKVGENTLDQARKGCIECADTQDNGLIPPERLGKRDVAQKADISPIQLAPISNGTSTLLPAGSEESGTAAAGVRRRFSGGVSGGAAAMVGNKNKNKKGDRPLPYGPDTIWDKDLPANFAFGETLLPLNKTAFVEYFNLKMVGVEGEREGPLYNGTAIYIPRNATLTPYIINSTSSGSDTSSDNNSADNSTSADASSDNNSADNNSDNNSSDGNSADNSSASDTSSSSDSSNTSTTTPPSTNPQDVSNSTSPLPLSKRSSACNCAHNADPHSWRDSMSPVERATEICIAGGGCKVTRDYEEMCVMVGGGPDPCACIAGAVGDYQSMHRGIWWLWSAVHCGGSAVMITNR